jgi:hypothetical protein
MRIRLNEAADAGGLSESYADGARRIVFDCANRRAERLMGRSLVIRISASPAAITSTRTVTTISPFDKNAG